MTSGGMIDSMALTEVKPRADARCPSWKIQVSAPSEAPRDTTLRASALTGMTTDPVMRNSNTKVANTTSRPAYGAPAAIDPVRSSRAAA
ncbi:MAG: hypothetical protein BWY91_01123 [bacterium ADurb.BinA028]|nr:MAG: hypothetical protein BWY91_01123 [bacterium ADurb.BinA028]